MISIYALKEVILVYSTHIIITLNMVSSEDIHNVTEISLQNPPITGKHVTILLEGDSGETTLQG
ncbi:MAG: hypothetical protein ACTS7E_02470 [Arsenophonus sp. NC-CH8-MAG3]